MSENIKLTNKQLKFIMEITEIKDPDDAVDRFVEIMVEERVDPSNIAILVDKILSRMKK